MSELEKILEEIDLEKKRISLSRDCSNEYAVTEISSLEKIEKIIRKHMDNGWIPVDERLPEEAGTYIINALDGKRNIVTFAKWQNGYKRFNMIGARAYWKVIAWRPLPEPYHPERSDNHDGE